MACPTNHRFDRARQGYLNLLPCSTRTAAIRATTRRWSRRAGFLDGGHYAPLAGLAELAAERAPQRWLDIGCGEGYYTAHGAALPDAEGYALDISREAIKRACKRAPQLEWLVASMARVPLAEPAATCWPACSVRWTGRKRDACSRPAADCCAWGRPASTCGSCARGSTTRYATTTTKHLSLIPDGMRLTHSETLSYELQLDNAQARADLLAMTRTAGAPAPARRRHRHAAGGAGCDTLRLDRTNFLRQMPR